MSARRHLCCVALGRYPTVVTKREPLTTFCIVRREVASDVHVAIVSRRECSSDRVLTAVVVPRGCNRVVEALATKRVATVSCSYYHSVVATTSGEVFAFGRNDYGQLGVGDTVDR